MTELEPADARFTAPKKRPKKQRKPRRRNGRSSARGTPPRLPFDLLTIPRSAMLTVPEVAAAVRRSAQSVRVWSSQPDHVLKFRKVDGRLMATVGAVLDYLNTPQKISTSKR